MTSSFLLLTMAGGIGITFSIFLLWLSNKIVWMIPVLHDPVFVPTTDEKLQMMLKLAQVKPGQKVADLGSGNGKILIAVAKLGAEVHGYETSPFLVCQSRHTIRHLKLD